MIKIHKFSFSDLRGVMEIERTSFPKTVAYSRAYFERYFRKFPEGFIIAKNRGKIVGYAIGGLRKKLGEFVSVAVKPKLRHKGVGTRLTSFLINLFRKRGAKEVSLNVRVGNKAAVSFYKKLGFGIVKTIKKYYRNGDNAYLMKKGLGG